MEIAFAPEEIVAAVQPLELRGGTDRTITGIAGLESAGPGDISFLGNPKYKTEVARTRASVVLLPAGFEGQPQPGQCFLLVPNPSAALGVLCARIERSLWPRPAPGIHPTAVIEPGARIAASATVGPLCVVEAGAAIGERTYLQAQVFVGRGSRIGDDGWLMNGARVATDCILGHRVRLQPGAIIGSDGFGYEFVQGRHERLPQIGNVILEDEVEVGAGSTIDRARFNSTVIGQGTKIDNLVQVGHNVRIGKHCLLCAQAGVSGSTVLEDYVVLGGQAGLAGHLTLGKGVQVGAQAGINCDWPAGTQVRGTPALPFMQEQRIQVLRNKLPELFKRVAALEERKD
ncbi:MAG TPA: UDP-3-O-(3-hydroxymyristoyl)glucosamine N-acyltransferase [Opitutaceae bacterium]|jgi:UDP-3-O-[3-hydroxymyristoyl] glucosamine N-acyltransferase|nr:UDP-3-O-(3-hydroxymyristoyl)glucosamine N-acyltransferase [Opitutaceae bacterium]